MNALEIKFILGSFSRVVMVQRKLQSLVAHTVKNSSQGITETLTLKDIFLLTLAKGLMDVLIVHIVQLSGAILRDI